MNCAVTTFNMAWKRCRPLWLLQATHGNPREHLNVVTLFPNEDPSLRRVVEGRHSSHTVAIKGPVRLLKPDNKRTEAIAIL